MTFKKIKEMSIVKIMMEAVETEAYENRPSAEAPPPAWVYEVAAKALVKNRCLSGPAHDETVKELEKL